MDEKEKLEVQYNAQIQQLNTFRSTLPQVRRALAHIPTYTICDDHDITDDWFLDGAWCQRELGSPLGRQIVRNGLLAYALFQALGNTPEQFEESNGIALLDAVDRWRGDASDANVSIIEDRLVCRRPLVEVEPYRVHRGHSTGIIPLLDRATR